jgi:hypothetical protein
MLDGSPHLENLVLIGACSQIGLQDLHELSEPVLATADALGRHRRTSGA